MKNLTTDFSVFVFETQINADSSFFIFLFFIFPLFAHKRLARCGNFT